MSKPPDRDPNKPPWFYVPWTTLEALQREHDRLRNAANAGKPERKRNEYAKPDRSSEWAEHLAEVLPIRGNE